MFSGPYLAFNVITFLEEKGAGCFAFFFVYGLCTVCHGLFALPLGVIGRLCSVSVATPGHLL